MKILRISSSPRKGSSQSIKLGDAIIERLTATHADSRINHKDLATDPFPHMEEVFLNALFTPKENHTEVQRQAISHSDLAIAEINEADVLLIESPMYNFTIPSTLKAWIDHIVRAGITFRYTENGTVGLITGKKVYVAIATGGVYSEGSMKAVDFITPYLQTVLGMIGLSDITFIRAEGLNVSQLAETALSNAITSINIEK